MTAVSTDDGELGDGMESVRKSRGCGGLEFLPPDLSGATSAFSFASVPFARTVEVLGLSVLPEPGILERRDRKDLDDSLVSVLLNDGYDWKPSGPDLSPVPLEAPESLDDWLPMFSRYQRMLVRKLWRRREGLDGVRARGSGRSPFEDLHSLPLHPSRSDCNVRVPQGAREGDRVCRGRKAAGWRWKTDVPMICPFSKTTGECDRNLAVEAGVDGETPWAPRFCITYRSYRRRGKMNRWSPGLKFDAGPVWRKE